MSNGERKWRSRVSLTAAIDFFFHSLCASFIHRTWSAHIVNSLAAHNISQCFHLHERAILCSRCFFFLSHLASAICVGGTGGAFVQVHELIDKHVNKSKAKSITRHAEMAWKAVTMTGSVQIENWRTYREHYVNEYLRLSMLGHGDKCLELSNDVLNI